MKKSIEPILSLRPMRETDVPYIMDSWYRGLRSMHRYLPGYLFKAAYRSLIIRLLKTSQVRVLADGDYIAGFSVCDDASGTLHWVYVRERDAERGKHADRVKMLVGHLPSPVRHSLRAIPCADVLELGLYDGFISKLTEDVNSAA